MNSVFSFLLVASLTALSYEFPLLLKEHSILKVFKTVSISALSYSLPRSVLYRIQYKTDNGSEFSNPNCIEYGPDGKGFQRTRIHYYNPSAPYQKAEIEVGHEFIRRVCKRLIRPTLEFT